MGVLRTTNRSPKDHYNMPIRVFVRSPIRQQITTYEHVLLSISFSNLGNNVVSERARFLSINFHIGKMSVIRYGVNKCVYIVI